MYIPSRSFIKNTILPALVVFVIIIIVMPKAPRWGFEYKKGSQWKYSTLISEFDFPVYKSDEQLAQEKLKGNSEVIPYFKYSEEVVNKSVKSLESISLGDYSALRPVFVSKAREIYQKGIYAEAKIKSDSPVVYIQRDKRASKVPESDAYKLADARAKFIADMSGAYPLINMDSLMRESGIYDMLQPNLFYDSQTTNLVHAESDAIVSPTLGYVKTGDIIVASGEVVTAEIAQVLDSYKTEYESNLGYSDSVVLRFIGDMIEVLAMIALLLLVLNMATPQFMERRKTYWFLLTLFLMNSILVILASKLGGNYFYLFPFGITALFLNAFFRHSNCVLLYPILLLPMLLFAEYGAQYYLMYLASGLIFLKQYNSDKRWQQFLIAFFNCIAVICLYCAMRLTGILPGSYLSDIQYLFIGSLLNVAAYPIVYLFERIFGLVSMSSLRYLCDSNNPLVHRLEVEAPGTFQHTLQVMNMCEAVARSIGANPLLVKTGAVYHDIGKVLNPLCFVENESLNTVEIDAKYHSEIDPMQSAKDIIQHVADGVALARKEGLPECIVDFIQTHHGTTCVSYFYDKYLKAGGSADNMQEFCYTGVKPRTKEEVILMACDSIEAASRSTKDHSPEAISKLVENVVNGKLENGQFYDADITLGQIQTMKESIKSYLIQMNHVRIAYPKMKIK